MKKLFFFAFTMVMAIAFTSCGNKGGEAANGENAEAAEVIKDGNKFEGKNFSLVYPKEWKESIASEETINASADGDVSFDATYNDMGPAVAELATYATNWKGMKQNAQVEEPVINEKVLTIKAVEGDKEEIHFVVMKEDKIGIAGSLKFPAAKEADFKPLLESIIKSVEFK